MQDTKAETKELAVRVHVRSVQYDYRESLSERISEMREKAAKLLADLSNGAESTSDEENVELYNEGACGDAGEPFDIWTEGRLRYRGNLCEISYMETGAEGLEDTRTTLVYSNNSPNMLTLTRTGAVKMTLSFEEGRYHIGNYDIGALRALFPEDHRGLSIASYARRVRNNLRTDGTLELDYIIEVRGMDTQRTRLWLELSDCPLEPRAFARSDASHHSSPDGEGDIQ